MLEDATTLITAWERPFLIGTLESQPCTVIRGKASGHQERLTSLMAGKGSDPADILPCQSAPMVQAEVEIQIVALMWTIRWDSRGFLILEVLRTYLFSNLTPSKVLLLAMEERPSWPTPGSFFAVCKQT